MLVCLQGRNPVGSTGKTTCAMLAFCSQQFIHHAPNDALNCNCADTLHKSPCMYRCILKGLKALHDAGLGHGDLRWENVIFVCVGWFILIDLESSVSLNNREEQQQLLVCGLRPHAWGARLEAWVDVTGPTGEHSKCFTKASDLYMLGRMLAEAQQLPEVHTGVPEDVVQNLLQKQYADVQQVLEALGLVAL